MTAKIFVQSRAQLWGAIVFAVVFLASGVLVLSVQPIIGWAGIVVASVAICVLALDLVSPRRLELHESGFTEVSLGGLRRRHTPWDRVVRFRVADPRSPFMATQPRAVYEYEPTGVPPRAATGYERVLGPVGVPVGELVEELERWRRTAIGYESDG